MTAHASTWLLGFGLGLVAGILGPPESALRLATACALLFCGWLLRAKVSGAPLFCVGVVWAFYFNPPILARNEPSLRVRRQATLLPSAARIIVGSSDGREFQAKGEGASGDEGGLRCFKRSWFFEACRFRPFFPSHHSQRNPLAKGTSWLRGELSRDLAVMDRFERSWLKALILGDESELQPRIREDFKKAGLYHLLVVSGFHFTVLCRLIEVLVRWPFQLAYSVGAVPSRSWVRLTCCLRIVIVAGAFIYGLLVSFQAPCQRALLGFGVMMLEPLFHGQTNLLRRMKWTVTIQTILFPGGFASISNLLSWGAYVFVVAAFVATAGLLAKVAATLLLQLKLLVLSFALIGKASLMGVLANALIAPLFPVVFLGGLVRLFHHGEDSWTLVIGEAQIFFVALVRAVADVAHGGLLDASPRRQWLLLGMSLLLFWRSLKRIQNSLEGPGPDCYPPGRAFTKGSTNGKTLGRQDRPDR